MEKKEETEKIKEQFAASAARKQLRREKSPSELGEEVMALMLSEDAKERAAATPAPPKIRAAAGTPKAAQYGRFTQEAAENAKTTQYGSGFTEKTAAGNRKTAPYGGAGAGRMTAQYEPPLDPQPQALAAAGLDDNAIRGVQWRNDFPSAMQEINQKVQKLDEITSPIHATPEWQTQAAAQDLAYAGLDANAQQGLAYGDGIFRLGQKSRGNNGSHSRHTRVAGAGGGAKSCLCRFGREYASGRRHIETALGRYAYRRGEIGAALLAGKDPERSGNGRGRRI